MNKLVKLTGALVLAAGLSACDSGIVTSVTDAAEAVKDKVVDLASNRNGEPSNTVGEVTKANKAKGAANNTAGETVTETTGAVVDATTPAVDAAADATTPAVDAAADATTPAADATDTAEATMKKLDELNDAVTNVNNPAAFAFLHAYYFPNLGDEKMSAAKKQELTSLFLKDTGLVLMNEDEKGVVFEVTQPTFTDLVDYLATQTVKDEPVAAQK